MTVILPRVLGRLPCSVPKKLFLGLISGGKFKPNWVDFLLFIAEKSQFKQKGGVLVSLFTENCRKKRLPTLSLFFILFRPCWLEVVLAAGEVYSLT